MRFRASARMSAVDQLDLPAANPANVISANSGIGGHPMTCCGTGVWGDWYPASAYWYRQVWSYRGGSWDCLGGSGIRLATKKFRSGSPVHWMVAQGAIQGRAGTFPAFGRMGFQSASNRALLCSI